MTTFVILIPRNFTERKESFQSPSVFCQSRVTEDQKVASISTKIDVLQLFVEASSSSPIVIVLASCALKKIILIPFQFNDPEKNYFNPISIQRPRKKLF